MGQFLARYAELAVDHHARGHDHGIVGRPQLVPGQIAADLDVAGKTHVWLGQQAIELAGHRLGALMIGRDACPHQPVRRRQTVDEVYAEFGIGA